MGDFFKEFFSALTPILPFAGVLIIGVAMRLLASTGVFISGGKIDDETRKLLRLIGTPLIYLGSLLTVFSVILSFWAFAKPYQPFVIGLWTITISVLPYLVGVLIVLILILVAVNYFYKRQVEKALKIKVDGVSGRITEDLNRIQQQDALLLVENVGKGKLTCYARLKSVTFVDEKGRTHEYDVNFINPKGLYLSWDDHNSHAVLREGDRRTVHVVKGSHDNNRPSNNTDRAVFIFTNSEESIPLAEGVYTIQVDFLRSDGDRKVYLSTFEKNLVVDFILLRWK